MTEIIIAIIWASVLTYAVWSVHNAWLQCLATKEPRETAGSIAIRKDLEWQRAELELLRKDLNKTTRVASSAALASGLREENK